MARWKDFVGSIFIGSGLKPKGDYPLMDAHDIVTEDGTRLDEKLKNVGDVKIELDASLEREGYAADAKAVGDRINNTLGDIHSVLKRI